jgi:hypothetical protein
MKQLLPRAATLLCLLSCAAGATIAVRPAAQRVRSGDQNGDGRADLWQRYDSQGRLVEIDRDTNFDGSADVEEYYVRGVLVRRESDRNFNGQTDLVEEFDIETHGQTRSVVDTDYDGAADLLVLFQDGRPVFSKRVLTSGLSRTLAPHDTVIAWPGVDHLVAFNDPFASDTSVRGAHAVFNQDGAVGLSTSGGLPLERVTAIGRLAPSTTIALSAAHADTLPPLFTRPSRAPPVS